MCMKMIKLKDQTHQRLMDVPVKERRESFDDVVNRLLDCFDEHCRDK